MVSEEDVFGVLKTVLDPELAFNIVDLGLVYGVSIAGNTVVVKMTLTTPACPFGPELIEESERKLRALKGVENARVELVWEPPWSPEKMSEQAKIELGLV